MKDIDTYVSQYSLSLSKEIKKLSAPLLQIYGIDIFLTYRFDKDGNYSLLTNSPPNAEYWHEREFYRTNGFYSSPRLFSPCKILISSIQDETLQNEKAAMKSRTQMDHECMVLKKPSPDIVLGFSFASTIPHNKIWALYQYTPAIFDRFIDYFLKESESMRKRCFENAVSILPYRGKAFTKSTDYIQNLVDLNRQNHLFQQSLNPRLNLLTPAEKTCIEYYIAGYTAQETADELHRSRRTIEAHFDHIRNKLNIQSKRELFHIYQGLQT